MVLVKFNIAPDLTFDQLRSLAWGKVEKSTIFYALTKNAKSCDTEFLVKKFTKRFDTA